MTFSDLPNVQTDVLMNGLPVTVCHHPTGGRAAAWLRVHAGSHDEDPHWPGLAHFFEHLLFRGTARYSAEQALMPYVQRSGGKLNASTDDRTTDFFFELLPPLLAPGLRRLLDMVGQPLLRQEWQQQERAIIEAEYRAWLANERAQQHQRIIEQANEQHPVTWFHAGNEQTLVIESPIFQRALRQFHQHFYQPARMELIVVGPQSCAELWAIVGKAAPLLARSGDGSQPAERPASGPLSAPAYATRCTDNASVHRLELTFLLDAVTGTAAAQQLARDFINQQLQRYWPRGLAAWWQQATQTPLDKQAPVLNCLYQYQQQYLLHWTWPGSVTSRPFVMALLELWQDCLAHDHTMLARWWQRVQRQLRNQQPLNSALSQAQLLLSEKLAVSETAFVEAVNALLQALYGSLAATASATDATVSPALNQQLRHLLASSHPDASGADTAPLPSAASTPEAVTHRLSSQRSHAALQLQWYQPSPSSPLVSCQPEWLPALKQQASMDGVAIKMALQGPWLKLQLWGQAQALPHTLQAMTQPLNRADSASLLSPAPASGMLLRQMLNHWHSMLPDPRLTADVILGAWHGLTLNLPDAEQRAINGILQRWQAPTLPELPSWNGTAALPNQDVSLSLANPHAEHAVLQWFAAAIAPATPAPQYAKNVVCWQLLAQCLQQPFYQALRVEQQIGYGVISQYHAVEGHPGLLVGVQSPHVAVSDIKARIAAQLQQLSQQVLTLSPPQWQALKEQLAQQQCEQYQVPEQYLDWYWPQFIAGYTPEQWQIALHTVTPEEVAEVARCLYSHVFTVRCGE